MTVIFADPNCQPERLDITHRRTTPVILLGQSSSGTSICAAVLRRHLSVAFGTESQYFVRYFNRVHRYRDLRQQGNLRALVTDLCRERWFERVQKFGYRVDPERVLARVQTPTLRGVIDAAMGDFAEHQRMPRWGDKTPEYLYHLDVMQQLLPEAQYIHLVRDGRDVTLSHFGRHWGPKNIVSGALEWREQVASVRQFARRLPASQLHELRYEDLLSRPGEVIRELIQFLGVQDADGVLTDRLAQRIEGDVRSDNYDKWRKKMSPEQIRLFERLAGGTLAECGYDTDCRQDATVSQWRRGVCDFHSWLGKWRFREQWQETWYKARLRSRDLLSGTHGQA